MEENNIVYNVYEAYSDDKGEINFRVIATIKGDQITGPDADMVRKMLLRGTSWGKWPDLPPDKILWGDYLWAARVDDSSVENKLGDEN
jgi:hypothetical protein